MVEEPFWPLDVTYFVTFDEESYSLKFLYWVLKYLDLSIYATGVKPGINRNKIYEIPFAFPSLPEQERIVSVLDEANESVQALRDGLLSKLAGLEELKQSVLEKAFVGELTDSMLEEAGV